MAFLRYVFLYLFLLLVKGTLLSNHIHECTDKSDQTNCDKRDCNKKDEFRCLDGKYISKYLVCDGHNDSSNFSDEIDCERHVCDEKSFRCSSGMCIPKSWECDGQNDCNDNSDENNHECKTRGCPADMFQCPSKQCLGISFVCDDVNDCGDQSDEKNCDEYFSSEGCTKNEYKCRETSMCIPLESRCNGVANCPMNDDEFHCGKRCEKSEFLCENGRCIPESSLCDNSNDCGDRSDEKHCGIEKLKHATSTMARYTECKQFRCPTGSCLPYDKVCDGHPDCEDGSDEEGKCGILCDNINHCQHVCQRTPSGPVCICRKGFALETDGTSCRDIDECKLDTCSQMCKNLVGSFQCTCFDGYVLRKDRQSCKVVDEPMEIITATRGDIRRMSANASSVNIVHRETNEDIGGLEVNAPRNLVYWSNAISKVVNRFDLQTKELRVVSGVGQAEELAVDWVTDNVYFLDGEKPASIKVCNIVEQKCSRLVQMRDSLRWLISIAVDPINGWIFWSQTGFDLHGPLSIIVRADTNGANQIIIDHEGVGYVTGIAIDYTRSRLYWADAFFFAIKYSDLDGKNDKTILNQQNFHPLGLKIFEESIYWLTTDSGVLMKCELYGDKDCKAIDIKSTNVYMQFTISHKSRQPPMKNACKNHTCDHMCVSRKDTFSCICPDGSSVAPKDKCKEEARSDMKSLKFETLMIRNTMTNETVKIAGHFNHHHLNGLTIGISVAVASVIFILLAYCYCKRGENNLYSVHFLIPSLGASRIRTQPDAVSPVVPLDGPECTAQITQVQTHEEPSAPGLQPMNMTNSDDLDTETEEGHGHKTRLIR